MQNLTYPFKSHLKSTDPVLCLKQLIVTAEANETLGKSFSSAVAERMSEMASSDFKYSVPNYIVLS